MTGILTSRLFALFLLVVSSAWDATGTWLTLRDRLHLDGNPFIRGMNWTQLAALLILLQAAFAVVFWFSWTRQEALWPDENKSFWQFLGYRLNKGFALKFNRDHLKTEFIYAGMLLMWFPVFGHLLSGLIITCPLAGGPSFADIFRRLGVENWRTAQNFTTLFIVAASLILAHWPMYLRYREGSKNRENHKE